MNRGTKTLLPTMKTLLQATAPQGGRDIQELNKRPSQHARDLPTLKAGDVLHMKLFHLESKEWEKGTITSKLDERSYMVETPDGDAHRRNRYHLRKTKEDTDPKEVSDITTCRSPEEQPTPAGLTQLSSPATAEKATAVTPKTAARPQRIKTTPSVSERLCTKMIRHV